MTAALNLGSCIICVALIFPQYSCFNVEGRTKAVKFKYSPVIAALNGTKSLPSGVSPSYYGYGLNYAAGTSGGKGR